MNLPFNHKQRPHNVLSITFDPSIPTNGRFAGYSGGWDWAAYVPVGDERGSRYWTFGMVREMYLVCFPKVSTFRTWCPKFIILGKHPNTTNDEWRFSSRRASPCGISPTRLPCKMMELGVGIDGRLFVHLQWSIPFSQ